MSSELSDHFFYKTDARKPSPKVKFCTSGRCKKGTVKVIWIPYEIEKHYPEKYEEEGKPNVTIPPLGRDDVWKYRYWLRCIARWDYFGMPENLGLPREEDVMKGAIVEYPICALYNPEKGAVDIISWDSAKHYDYKLYNPHNNSDFFEMAKYFEGYLSSEVDCESFEDWFFDEYRSRVMERIEREEKRKRNRNTDISYAKRGYWFEEKPEDSD